jgi:hypothetical protein
VEQEPKKAMPITATINFFIMAMFLDNEASFDLRVLLMDKI